VRSATWNGARSISRARSTSGAEAGQAIDASALGDEIRALRRPEREQDPKSTWVFTTEKGGPFTPDGINKLVKWLGKGVVSFPAHMLRHSTGYHLAERDRSTRLIQDYLGHRSIQSTVRYADPLDGAITM
jgi:integrase